MEEQLKKEEKNKKQKLKISNKKILLFAILLVISIYLIYTIYLLVKQPTKIFTLEEGILSSEETNIGYVIRNEQVIQGQNYKNGMERIKAEGEKAAVNEPVFRYYSKNEEDLKSKISENEQVIQGQNYKNGMERIKAEGEKAAVNEPVFRYYSKNEEDLKSKISDLDAKIQEAMSKETDIFTSDMKSIETQIDTKLQEISKLTDVTKLLEYKKEISSLITKKANIAGDSSPQGSYLKELINKRKEYEKQLNSGAEYVKSPISGVVSYSGAEYVKSPISGVVSYKVDGLEDVLKPTNDCFSTLNKEYLDKLNLKTGKIVPTSEESGKIIDNTSCYIATITNSENAKNAKVGQKVEIRLPNNEETKAEITYISQEGDDDILLILKINKHVEELIEYRKISFDLIWWSENGLKVPNQAIINENELNYVIRNRAGYLDKLLVKVVRQGEKYSLVKPYNTEELKELGFSSNEIISYKKITLYDEIVLNPDVSKIKE